MGDVINFLGWLENKRRALVRSCIICGAPLEGRRPHTRYCRGDCAAEGAKRNAAARRQGGGERG